MSNKHGLPLVIVLPIALAAVPLWFATYSLAGINVLDSSCPCFVYVIAWMLLVSLAASSYSQYGRRRRSLNRKG